MENESGILAERLAAQARDVPLEVTPPFPKNLMIELGNECNHACRFCYNKQMERSRGLIAPPFLSRVLREAYAAGAREVGFATTGEPLLHPRLFHYVREAVRLGFSYTYFSTNGARLTPDRIEALLDSGLHSIKLSINAGTAETYARVHGKNDFEHVIEMVQRLDRRRRETGSALRLLVTSVVTPHSEQEVQPLRDRLEDVVDDLAFFPETGAVGPTNSMNAPLPCFMVFNRAHVTWEGYLTACCVDYENNLVVADLEELSLVEAWHSLTFQELRRRHLERDVRGTLCHVCITREPAPFEPLSRTQR